MSITSKQIFSFIIFSRWEKNQATNVNVIVNKYKYNHTNTIW